MGLTKLKSGYSFEEKLSVKFDGNSQQIAILKIAINCLVDLWLEPMYAFSQ